MKAPRKSLLLVVGMPGSGKSTAARAASQLGFRVLSFGDIVREEVRRRGLAKNEQNVERVADWFHSGRERLLAHRLEKKLRAIRTSKPFYIVEGARSPKQLSELKKRFSVKILAIVLPSRMRWARELSRGRSDIRTVRDAKERDAREARYGISRLIGKADWHVSSTGSEKEFRARSRRFFAALLA